MDINQIEGDVFSRQLLRWYQTHKRDLPWRKQPVNPYHIWLSEIMLQQTTVVTVIPYYIRFLEKWPTLLNLAAAKLDDVLTEWQGLGYYSRARQLHKCAQLVKENYQGKLPSAEQELLKLPGIGAYTAAAIASIAYEQPAMALDGNVHRLLSRYFGILKAKVEAEKEIKKHLKERLPSACFGDFTQALIEMGALICRPKKPLCFLCPIQENCQAYKKGIPEEYPLRQIKKELPTRYTTAFILRKKTGEILLRKREEKGLLGGMMEVPTTPWGKTFEEFEIEMYAPAKIKWVPIEKIVKHTFTHFHLMTRIQRGTIESPMEGIWVESVHLKDYALPTLMKKIIQQGLKDLM